MCPESLAHLARGTAEVGDQVVAKDFKHQGSSHTFTMYARTDNPTCPVCLPNGATICFKDPSRRVRRLAEVTDGPVVATLANGAFYESTFAFANGATATLSEIRGAVFNVIPAIATSDEINEEARRIFTELSPELDPVLAQAAATARIARTQSRGQTVAA